MPAEATLPILRTAGQAYALLWRERRLHAKAIWPPILFLVTAEFLYHRIFGDAHGPQARWHALVSSAWYMPLLAAVAWLIGLKFLLSFSISWRRHLLRHERFDPFFFKKPFWRYLGFLILTYAWSIPLVLLSIAVALALGHTWHAPLAVALLPVPVALGVALWAVVRQVPFFTALTLDPPHPGWRDGVRAMRGVSLRYTAAWILAMLPIALLDLGLDTLLKHVGADPHAAAVALGESTFRQAMLFLHFSLGASIGAATFVAVFDRDRNGVETGLQRART